MKAKELLANLQKLSVEDLNKKVVYMDIDSFCYEAIGVRKCKIRKCREIEENEKGKEVILIE